MSPAGWWDVLTPLRMTYNLKLMNWDFPGGAVVKNPPANAGETGSILVREDPTCHGATKPVCHNY